jgi:hypothetical protein
MNKLKAFYDLFKVGRMVADPVFWKKMQAEGQPALAGVLIGLVALLKGTKYEIQIDDSTLGFIAGGIFAVGNWMLTRITTTKDIRIVPIVERNEPVPAVVQSPSEDRVQPVTQAPTERTSATPSAPTNTDPAKGTYFGD